MLAAHADEPDRLSDEDITSHILKLPLANISSAVPGIVCRLFNADLISCQPSFTWNHAPGYEHTAGHELRPRASLH